VTLLAIANFVGTPFEVTGKTVMATVLFMLYGLFFSMMNCSYGAMVPAITKNPDERASLAAWRQGGATLGLLLCTVGFVPVMNLIEGNSQLGYIFAATLFSLFGLLFMWWCYAGVKERYVEVKPVDAAQKPGLLQSFRAIAGNRRCLFCALPTFARLARLTSSWRFRSIHPVRTERPDPPFLDGLFQHGLYLHRRLLDAGNGQTFRQEKGLHRFVDLGRGRSAQLLLWRRFGQLCRFLVPGVLRLSVRQQPELGAGLRHGGIWRMAYRRAFGRNGIHRLHLLS
jgi:GPH family glycoside/pentoside/hexuronide:cation symporter